MIAFYYGSLLQCHNRSEPPLFCVVCLCKALRLCYFLGCLTSDCLNSPARSRVAVKSVMCSPLQSQVHNAATFTQEQFSHKHTTVTWASIGNMSKRFPSAFLTHITLAARLCVKTRTKKHCLNLNPSTLCLRVMTNFTVEEARQK
jgi:hypothetical protein